MSGSSCDLSHKSVSHKASMLCSFMFESHQCNFQATPFRLNICGEQLTDWLSAVVWKHCDHGLVGRPVAQRGLRQLLWVRRRGRGREGLGHGRKLQNSHIQSTKGKLKSFTVRLSVRASQRDIMIIDDVLPVMVDDALLSSHPIITNVSTPDEITAVFDSISYSKVQRPQDLDPSCSTLEPPKTSRITLKHLQAPFDHPNRVVAPTLIKWRGWGHNEF